MGPADETPALGALGAELGQLRPPSTLRQVGLLTRYQLTDYLRSRRFVILFVLVAAIAAILTLVIAYYRPPGFVSDPLAFYANVWGGGAPYVVVLATIFFGGDAIAGEFQNKTGYFLMGQPVRRAAVYSGKYIAAFVASFGAVALYALIMVGNGLYYFGTGAFPWALGESLLLTVGYLLAVLGTTFLFSSLFKTSAYGILLTAVLFLFGFTLLQDLVTGLIKVEPWFVISYASSVIGNVFQNPYPPHVTQYPEVTFYVVTIPEAIGIMILYFVLAALSGLFLFEREEFS